MKYNERAKLAAKFYHYCKVADSPTSIIKFIEWVEKQGGFTLTPKADEPGPVATGNSE